MDYVGLLVGLGVLALIVALMVWFIKKRRIKEKVFETKTYEPKDFVRKKEKRKRKVDIHKWERKHYARVPAIDKTYRT